MPGPTASAPMVSIMAGSICIGFVLRDARGFEATDADGRSLGRLATLHEAAASVSENIRTPKA
jgi:hypothetical protein